MRASLTPLASRLSSEKSNASSPPLERDQEQPYVGAPALKLEAAATGGMDRRIPHRRWSPTGWPIALRVLIAVTGTVLLVLLVVRLLSGSGERTVRLPAAQVTVATVEKGIFHDL